MRLTFSKTHFLDLNTEQDFPWWGADRGEGLGQGIPAVIQTDTGQDQKRKIFVL